MYSDLRRIEALWSESAADPEDHWKLEDRQPGAPTQRVRLCNTEPIRELEQRFLRRWNPE